MDCQNNKTYHVSTHELESNLSELVAKGVTELVVGDSSITGDKKRLLRFLSTASRDANQIHLIILLDYAIIDKDVCFSLSKSFCSIDLSFSIDTDRRLMSKKANLLNQYGIVFGFDMAIGAGDDNLKKFRDRLDFVLSLYPNHIDFPQLEESEADCVSGCRSQSNIAFQSTAFFSRQDYMTSLKIAFAASVFYTAGRAVPWFLSAIEPLKMTAARFFEDFSEWQQCNNCSLKSDFDSFSARHEEIEKMQLVFLKLKYEEKHISDVFEAVSDLIRIHGAFSRLVSSDEESVLNLSWNPEDLLSSQALDICSFFDTVCMAPCRIRVFNNSGELDYKMLPI